MDILKILKPNTQKIILTIAGYIVSLFIAGPFLAAKILLSTAQGTSVLSVVINVLYYIIAFGHAMGNILLAGIDPIAIIIFRALLQIIYVYIIICIALKLFQKEPSSGNR